MRSQTENGEQTQRLARAESHYHPRPEGQREVRWYWNPELGLPGRSQNYGHISSGSWNHGVHSATARETSVGVREYSRISFGFEP